MRQVHLELCLWTAKPKEVNGITKIENSNTKNLSRTSARSEFSTSTFSKRLLNLNKKNQSKLSLLFP